MRCSSYCTADSYNLNNKLKGVISLGYHMQLIERVIYARSIETNKNIDIFIFNFGCVVIWGANEQEESEILAKIKYIEKGRLTEKHYEYNNFNYNSESDKTYIDEENNLIYLGNKSENIKLSISHALAQSVKLEELEQYVEKLLKQTESIQKELAAKGSVSLSKSAISKQLGVLFNARYLVNIHSDILDIPEFFWRRPSLEPIYLMTVKFQDITIRQGVLNNHLNLIHDLYSMLSSDLDHKHSTRLEIIIIALITIEVFFALQNSNILQKLISAVTILLDDYFFSLI